MRKKDLLIFGGGEIALLARYYFDHDSQFCVKAFVVDDEFVDADTLDGLPVVALSECSKKYPASNYFMHVALSYSKLNSVRQAKYLAAKSSGYSLVSYISTNAVISQSAEIGENCFILEQQNIQPFVKIGDNVMLWSGNHIGHGTQIANHSYISSHVVISGNCRIGERCFFGVNAATKDFVTVGNDVFVGMSASITKNIEKGSVVLGQGSEILEATNRKAIAIKKSYFGT